MDGEADDGGISGLKRRREAEAVCFKDAALTVARLDAVRLAADVVPERGVQHHLRVALIPAELSDQPLGVDVDALRVSDAVQARVAPEPGAGNVGSARGPARGIAVKGTRHPTSIARRPDDRTAAAEPSARPRPSSGRSQAALSLCSS